MKIGNIILENNLSLGPMAGITNSTFRILCKEKGCGLVFSEMISAKGIYYKDKKTELLLKISNREKPIAYQIFGSEPKVMAFAAQSLESYDNEILDINMGCPAPKIVKNGDGAALLKEPKKIGEIVSKVVKATQKPVSVKIRIGWDENSINAVEVAKIIEESGAVAITVHGRTREQFYSGKADWGIIKEVKENVNIPVIGNGDVFNVIDATKIKEETNCDGIMIARGAQGNPWIFEQILHYIKTKEILPEPSIEEKVNMAIRHANMLIEEKGEYIAVKEMRKHIGWYLKGQPKVTEIRKSLNTANSRDELLNLLYKYIQNIK